MSKRKGSRNEHKAMRILEAAGYHTTRAAGSFGLFDIVAINAQGPSIFLPIDSHFLFAFVTTVLRAYRLHHRGLARRSRRSNIRS